MVKLDCDMWDRFSTYLFIDRKLDNGKGNVGILQSRFKILVNYFSNKEFNRENFTLFILYLKTKGYQNSYINGFIKLGKHLDKFLDINQLQDYTYFKEKQKDIIAFTPEEVDKISRVGIFYTRLCEELNKRDYIAIQFMFNTGCRFEEIQNLSWIDVRSSPVPHVIFRDTKNDEDHTLAIPQRIYDLLMSLPHHGERVFDSHNYHKLERVSFAKMLKKRAESCGIEKPIYPHILRHSRGTYLAKVGFTDGQIARQLNHKDINTTKKYIHTDLTDSMALAYASPMEQKDAFSTAIDLGKKFIYRFIDPSKWCVSIDIKPL